MTWIKICGITSKEDAEAAIGAGASAIGLVFASSSRRVTLDGAKGIADAVRGRIELVGVFKETEAVETIATAIGFDRVQIHNSSPLALSVPVLRAVRPDLLDQTRVSEGETTLVDGSEGQGIHFDWARLRSRPGPFVIAGGLTPGNVGAAMVSCRPYGVDVSSGVESAPGRKDPAKMARFVEAVRRTDGNQ